MSDNTTLVAHLTQEIRDLMRLGPVHSFTWVSQRDPGCWMQVSVHDGSQHYLTVLCVLPPHISKDQMDKMLGKIGRNQSQANHGTCLIYYLSESDNPAQLLDQAASAAQQCATIAGLLWDARKVEDLELLGARGPKLPLQGGQRASIAPPRSTHDAIPKAPPPAIRSAAPASGDSVDMPGL